MASGYRQQGPSKLFQAQKTRKQNPGPGRLMVPPPQDEDSRVKCKDCGAFGHNARSLRCPMKRWQGALAPQPLGSKLGKENLEPRKLQAQQTPRTLNTAEREKDERQREGAGPQHCQEPDHPSRPLIREDDMKSVHPAVSLISRSLVQDSKSSMRAPGKRSAQLSTQTCLKPPKKPRLSPVQTPQKGTLTADLGAFQNLPSPPRTPGRGPTATPQRMRKTPAQGQRLDLQPPLHRSCPSHVQARTTDHPPPPSHVPGQHLRMLFVREGEGWWSCRYTAAPLSVPPSEQPAPPAQNPPVSKKPEGHFAPGPRSVLYDDLQVSSSSEESDWEGDTNGN